MKLILAAAVALSSLSAPVLAMDIATPLPLLGISVDGSFSGFDAYGRRSGQCPKIGARVIFREGSTCGGV